jgi:hypothetical protein
MQLLWIGVGLAGAAGVGFAVAWVVLSRLVIKLQLAPVAIQNVELPVDATVVLDGALDVNVEVPVEVTLTARELGLERITVPIDIAVPIDEEIAIDTTLAIDTTVTSVLGVSVPVKANLPIRTKVPIRHKVRVKETIEVFVGDLRLPLRAVVPLRAKVPITEPIRVSGKVRLSEGLPVQLGSIRIRPTDVKVSLE